MSPLAVAIAQLLSPAHQEEWCFDLLTIRHRPTGLELWVSMHFFLFDTWPKTGVLTLWERWRLRRMALRVVQYLRRRERSELMARLREKLLTAEERAVEDLLRAP